MKIRSITCFFDPRSPQAYAGLDKLARLAQEGQALYNQAGIEVQTTRLATVPFLFLLHGQNPGELVELAQSLESAAGQAGYDYLSLGPALPDSLPSYDLIPKALEATQSTFFGGLMTTSGGGISLPAVRLCAEVIAKSAPISPDGFANLRFAALANVPPGTPFFPAAYHFEGKPTFALALQAADLAVNAFSGASSVNQAQRDLIESMQVQAAVLERVSLNLETVTGAHFGGIDFSLAPFPEQALSLGTAMEALGVPALGMHGSLAAAAIVADAMDRARFRRAGFSGLMLPVLEDAVLAQRAAEGSLGVKDLLLFSAVCGTGLDTVPLPGDTSPEEIYPLLLDLASLAQRLDKPLTARLMPVPGKRAGDPTGFDFTFFANSRVLPLQAARLTGALAGEDSFSLSPRRF